MKIEKNDVIKKGKQEEQDTYFMLKALDEAQKAFGKNEVPVGALIVNENDEIIGVGHNRVEEVHCQIAHAEMEAISMATGAAGDWRLDSSTLYVTLEPCSMCMATISLSRIGRVVYGADSPEFGFKKDQKLLIGPSPYEKISLKSGVKSNECLALLQNFFKKQR